MLVARHGDLNSHGNGAIVAFVTTVFVNGMQISTLGDNSLADSQCGGDNPITHCNPKTTVGSLSVFAEGKGVHRIEDFRLCGAKTSTSSPNVFCG